MTPRLIKTLAGLAIAVISFAAATGASAQAFPNKPMRIIVPFAAGGSSDVLARAIARSMTEGLKNPVIVENRPGAGGVIAMEAVARATPDGHTLLFTTNGTHSIGPALYPNRKIDSVKELAPVALMHTLPNVLLVHPSVPAKNVGELIAYAKANPGKINFASAGNGSASHLFGELFKLAAGIDIVHVPYKGGGAAMPDLISGQVSMMLETIPSALAQVRSGKLNALAVTSAKRAAAAPEIPTIAESGIPGFDAFSWSGLSTTAGTPPAVIAALNAETARISKDPAYLEILKGVGVEPVIASADAFDAYIKKDTAKWIEVVKKANIKAE
jgi:tripartite-type tricarboxylate transporter receptor subunit TctC